MSMRLKRILIVLLLLVTIAVGCTKEKNDDVASNKTNVPESAKTDSGGLTYAKIESVSVPDNYPAEKLPLSKDENDKIMKINSIDDTTFDFKIASIRTYQEIIEEYAAMWELEDENVFYIDDIGVGNLTGKLDGYEIFINASEGSPDMPEGARTYVGILIRKLD